MDMIDYLDDGCKGMLRIVNDEEDNTIGSNFNNNNVCY